MKYSIFPRVTKKVDNVSNIYTAIYSAINSNMACSNYVMSLLASSLWNKFTVKQIQKECVLK